jgi:hypothetical protein
LIILSFRSYIHFGRCPENDYLEKGDLKNKYLVEFQLPQDSSSMNGDVEIEVEFYGYGKLIYF